MTKQLLFTAFALILFISCKKEQTDCSNQKYYELNQKLKPYLFEVGSHWIYKDSASGERDSVIVISSELYYESTPKCYSENQMASIHYKSYNPSSNYSEALDYNGISRNHTVIYPLDTSRAGSPKLIATISSLQIEDKTYTNVKEYQLTTVDGYVNYYFEKKIGIVKKTTNSNGDITTSNLIRYKIKLKQ